MEHYATIVTGFQTSHIVARLFILASCEGLEYDSGMSPGQTKLSNNVIKNQFLVCKYQSRDHTVVATTDSVCQEASIMQIATLNDVSTLRLGECGGISQTV